MYNDRDLWSKFYSMDFENDVRNVTHAAWLGKNKQIIVNSLYQRKESEHENEIQLSTNKFFFWKSQKLNGWILYIIA